MQQYRIKPGGYAEIRPRLLRSKILILLFLFALLAVQSYYLGAGSGLTRWLPLGIMLVSMPAVLLYQLRRQRTIFESYLLTVAPDNLIRAQEHVPSIVLPYADITGITQNRNGSLLIRGRDINQSIGVPAQLENLPALRAQLAALHPITEQEPTRNWSELLLMGLLLGAAALLFWADNRVVVGLAGFTATALLIRNYWVIRRSRHLDRQVQRAAAFSLIPTLVILATTISKLLR
jgi:hypothetical protein